jgi:mannosyltransferase
VTRLNTAALISPPSTSIANDTTSSAGNLGPVRKPIYAHTWVLLAILLVGFGLRLYRLDHPSIWYDEAFSMTIAQPSLSEVVAGLVTDFVHPPLHYFILHGWFALTCFGPVQARLLSVIFGTLTVVPMYFLAKYLFDARTAVIAALLMMVSQLGIEYSQEVRPYAKVLFFVVCTIFFFIRALRERNLWAWCACVISATLMSLTHYYTAFVIATLIAYALLCRKRYTLPWKWWIAGAAFLVLAWVPWLMSGVVQHALQSPRTTPGEQPAWFSINLGTPFATINRFNNGAFFGFFQIAPKWVLILGGLLFTAPALRALASYRSCENRDGLLFLAMLWLLPLGGILILSIGKYPYDVRYVMFCVAPYYILVARGISLIKPQAVRVTLLVLILAYSVFALRSNYYIPYKENYRDALALVADEAKDGDCCVFVPFRGVPLQWSIYHGSDPHPPLAELERVLAGSAPYQRVWLVQYRKVVSAAQACDEAKRKLESAFQLENERHYFCIDVSLYTPKAP